MTPLKVGSLFAGYGGLDLGIQQVLDAETEWFCEFDEAPSKILNHHWPTVPNYGDVTKIDWETVPPVDIIAGGSPCQDLSQAGKRAGMTEGTRSNLWVNMREAIRVVRPRLVVWENVRGALSATATSESDMEQSEGLLGKRGGGHLRALGRVLGDLTDIGYDARWTTVRASDIGAPHHRARVFLVAYPSDSSSGRGISINDSSWRTPACREGDGWTDGSYRSEVTPHSEGSGRDHGQAPDDGQADREVNTSRNHRDATADPERNDGGAGSGFESGWEARFGAPTAGGPEHCRGTKDENPADTGGGQALPDTFRERRDGRGATSRQAQGRGAHRESDGCSIGVHWGEYAPAVRRWERIVGPAPAPTELNSRGNPRLNAAFAEWMMGLPAGHVTAPEIGLTRAQQLKALGNGVVPQQATAVLRVLLGSDF